MKRFAYDLPGSGAVPGRSFPRLFEHVTNKEQFKQVDQAGLISQCCGAAGIAEFFLSLHQVTGKPEYLDFARRVLDNVVSRAFADDKGYRWYQSEFRVQPWIVAAQTGYMQGAAGVGSALLHLHTALDTTYHAVLFPYNPFPREAAEVKS